MLGLYIKYIILLPEMEVALLFLYTHLRDEKLRLSDILTSEPGQTVSGAHILHHYTKLIGGGKRNKHTVHRSDDM